MPNVGEYVLSVNAIGTAPIKRIDIIHNESYAYNLLGAGRSTLKIYLRGFASRCGGEPLLRSSGAGGRQFRMEFAGVGGEERERMRLALVLFPLMAYAQTSPVPLKDLQPHHVKVEAVTYRGRD